MSTNDNHSEKDLPTRTIKSQSEKEKSIPQSQTKDKIMTDKGIQTDQPSVDIEYDDIQRLVNELEVLVAQLRKITPDFTPPTYSQQRLLQLIEDNIERLSPNVSIDLLERIRSKVNQDILDPDTWKGMWYMLNYYLEYQGETIKRRISGEYETDDWGYDPEFLESIQPIFEYLYYKYWRVETEGIENIPGEGRALLVSNHSGQIPWDGTMIGIGVKNHHPANRLIRGLYAGWFPKIPFISSMLVKLGQTLANEENGVRLLEQEELVLVFPEGLKGITKLYKDRYKLARFGRGGFIRMALKTGSPIIPVAVVGAEETYITLRHTPFLNRMTGYPFPPISLTWPWLGLLGLVPLPTKWFIDIGKPILVDGYSTSDANNLILVSQLTNQVRNVIQKMIYERLSARQSVFFG